MLSLPQCLTLHSVGRQTAHSQGAVFRQVRPFDPQINPHPGYPAPFS